MHEQLKHVLAASVLAVAPAAVEQELSKIPPVYIKSADDKEGELSRRVQLPEVGQQGQRVARLGNFTQRMAARNNQMGHRYRGDTR